MSDAKPGKPGNPAWTKGVSGNPSGRPKLSQDIRARALRAVDEHVISAWLDEVELRDRPVTHMGRVLTDELGQEVTTVRRGPDWVQCSRYLAEYGIGKPVQPVASSDMDGNDNQTGIAVTFVRSATPGAPLQAAEPVKALEGKK